LLIDRRVLMHAKTRRKGISHEGTKARSVLPRDCSVANSRGPFVTVIEELATKAIDCGFRIHKQLGPGLLESAYETVLAFGLAKAGLAVERQKPIPIIFDGIVIADAFRADLVIENQLIIEIKSIERLAPVHAKQLLTYVRLMEQPLGLLMNFGSETFRDGLRRVVNGPSAFKGSRSR